MALVPTCDRCLSSEVQLEPVLGVELCPHCVATARAWLQSQIGTRRTATGRIDRRLQAHNMLLRAETISAERVAQINGEPYRKAYFGLMSLAKSGALKHRGNGVFERPKEAAE